MVGDCHRKGGFPRNGARCAAVRGRHHHSRINLFLKSFVSKKWNKYPTGRISLQHVLAQLRNRAPGKKIENGNYRRLGAESVEPTMVEGGKGTAALQNDGIIHLLWKPRVRIEAADAQAAMAAVNAVANGSEYPMLVDMTTTESLSRQARSVFTIRCAASRIALLGSSPVDRILANWSLGVQNLPCPTRFFNSSTEAMRWLLLH